MTKKNEPVERTSRAGEGAEERRSAILRRLNEREAMLRGLLLDARDELVRRSLEGPQPANGEYALLRERVAAALRRTLPAAAKALVVSRGDDALLAAGAGFTAEHFPGDAGGGYAGHHPADSDAAIVELERRRAGGAGFFVLPASSSWWLHHYAELARHLDRYRRVVDEPGTAIVFDLRQPFSASGVTREAEDSTTREARPAAGRRIAATTIISRNYLAQARVLARSFLEHEPDGRFYLLVVDRLPEGVEVGVDVTLVDPRDLAIPNFYEMCFKYDVVELSTAVKPYLLSHLFERYGEEDLVYLDPDILIERPMPELRDALDRGSAVLTPHITRPLPVDGKHPTEQDIMISGAYNLGFIALRRSPEARELLAWWEEKLCDGCRIDVQNGLFTDQKWIDLVPSLFPSVFVLRDPTYNVAFWNLHEREITRDGERFLVNGRPATFFHVSGFDPRKPGKLSKHQSRIEVEPGSALARLLERYAGLLLAAGYEEASGWEYGYERFANGARVHPLLRQIFLSLSPEERNRFGDPFANGPGSFVDWATGPGERPDDLSRFLEAIYQTRYDLPLAFPDARGRDRRAFVDWARRWGAEEMRYEPELVRDSRAPIPSNGARAGGANGRPTATEVKTVKEEKAGEKSPRTRRALPLEDYRDLVDRIRDVARATLPVGARVLVVNKGDYRLLDLGGAEGWHFPQTQNGIYGGFYPPDSATAIAHLEALRARGADHLLLPATAAWWLDHYAEFREHLEARYRCLVRDESSCTIFDLRGPGAIPAGEAATTNSGVLAPPPATEIAPIGSPRRTRSGAGDPVPPIVIYGAARSGTTFLVQILNRHPDIYISDESRAFLWAHEMMQRIRWHERSDRGRFDEAGGRRVEDRRGLRDHLRRSLPGMLRDYYREIGDGATHWGDKNPHYADPRDVGCLETIVELFPGARFLHLIRDGRDVVTSGMRGVWTDFDRVHAMWTSHLDLGRSFGRTLPAGQYIELHYEELVADGVGTASRVLDLLGIEPDPEVEAFCRRQERERIGVCAPTRDLGDPLRSDWASFFSAADRIRSLELLGEHLVRFGYETPRSLAEARRELEPQAAAEGLSP